MTHKLIKLLAIIASLYTGTAHAEKIPDPEAGITILATDEQDAFRKNYAEVLLKPDIKWEQGEYKIGYYGSFFRSKDSTGAEMRWLTLASEIQAENYNWTLDIGRANTRQYAGFLYAPITPNFDNQGMLKGTVRTYTGTILTHKGTGLSLGQVAHDTRMTPTHWDNTLLGWKSELTDEWALHLQATTGKQLLSSAGATIKWQADCKTTVVAEGFYLNHEKTGILTANHKLTDDLTLFTGAQITSPRQGKPDGLATLGASLNIGHGLTLVAATQQQIGGDRRTTALLAIKYAGDFRQK